MKIFHIADLHFGKKLYDISMVTSDQKVWAENFLKAVDEEKPDAIVIAGDVYDQRQPSEDAVALLSDFLKKLAARDVYVFMVSGNHDSAVRLSFGKEIFENKKIYIAGPVTKALTKISLEEADQKYDFWLMPYIFPKLVSGADILNDPEIDKYDEAVRRLLKLQPIDKASCNILVAHQNVLAGANKPEHSESETFIGNLGEVDYSAFDAFDYVALGHIHNMQSIGRDTVRYAGCPLYYDFSEVNRQKAITVVEFNGKENIKIRELHISILHYLKAFKGSMAQIINDANEFVKADGARDNNYFIVKYTDESVSRNQIDKLKNILGSNLVRIEVDINANRIGIRRNNTNDNGDFSNADEFYGMENFEENMNGHMRKVLGTEIGEYFVNGNNTEDEAEANKESTQAPQDLSENCAEAGDVAVDSELDDKKYIQEGKKLIELIRQQQMNSAELYTQKADNVSDNAVNEIVEALLKLC